MATLSNADISKRNNVSVLVNRINNKAAFKLTNENSDNFFATGEAKIYIKNEKYSFGFRGKDQITEEDVRKYLDAKGTKRLEIELKGRSFVNITRIFKDKEFGGTASKSGSGGSERQERGLVDAINNALTQTENVFISQLGRRYIKVAKKIEGRAPNGKEPYVDVTIKMKSGASVDISMKGEAAPSLAGGGLAGIKDIDPNLVNNLWNKAKNYIIRDLGYKDGQVVNANDVPDLSIEIPQRSVRDIFEGSPRNGGPITHMYIGPMDVTSNLNANSGELSLNGTFYSVNEYIKKVDRFYLIIRKRDISEEGKIEIDLNGSTKNKEGLPCLMRDPRTKKNNTRIIIQDKPRGQLIQ